MSLGLAGGRGLRGETFPPPCSSLCQTKPPGKSWSVCCPAPPLSRHRHQCHTLRSTQAPHLQVLSTTSLFSTFTSTARWVSPRTTMDLPTGTPQYPSELCPDAQAASATPAHTCTDTGPSGPPSPHRCQQRFPLKKRPTEPSCGLSGGELKTERPEKSILIFHLVVPECLSTKGVTNKHFWERIVFPRTGKSEMISPFRMRAVCLSVPPVCIPRGRKRRGEAPRPPEAATRAQQSPSWGQGGSCD